jgi:hypothetical protein
VKDWVALIVGFIEEFTVRKALALALVLAAIVLSLMIYERATSGFELSRLERAASILESLSHIPDTAGGAVVETRARIVADLEVALDRAPLMPSADVSLPELDRWAWKFGSAVALLGALGLLLTLAEKEDKMSLLIGSVFLGAFVGLLNMFVPTAGWPWFNLLVMPLAILALLFGIIAAIGIRMARKADTVK